MASRDFEECIPEMVIKGTDGDRGLRGVEVGKARRFWRTCRWVATGVDPDGLAPPLNTLVADDEEAWRLKLRGEFMKEFEKSVGIESG